MAPPAAARSPLRLTFPELWAVLAVALPVLGATIASISTVDLAYQLRAGGIVLDTGRLPSPDSFTFTAAGRPWLDQQWGAQVLLAAVFRAGGWALLAVGRALLVGVSAALVLAACRASGVSLRGAAWLTLGSFVVGLVTLGMRPQLLGMVLFAAILAILAGRERHPRLAWAIPVLLVASANAHGSFVFGPAAVVVAALEEAAAGRWPVARRLGLAAALAVVATLVGPYGPAVWTYAVGLTANGEIRRLVTEWQVTSPLSFVGVVFYGSIVGAAVLLVRAARRGAIVPRRAWPTLLWLAGLAVVGAFAERGVAWWSIGAPIAVARLVAPPRWLWTERPKPRVPPRALNGLLAWAPIVAIVVLLPIWRGGDPTYGSPGLLTDAPKSLTEAVRSMAGPTDRIWNAQRWGSWLEFAVPGTPVAVDSRIELIPNDAWEDHLAVSRGDPAWSAILDRRGVTIVVAAADEQRDLLIQLRTSPDWRLVADEPDGAVFVRSGPALGAGYSRVDAQ